MVVGELAMHRHTTASMLPDPNCTFWSPRPMAVASNGSQRVSNSHRYFFIKHQFDDTMESVTSAVHKGCTRAVVRGADGHIAAGACTVD
jgi:Leu/Phe-tRNA-protein transferase